jgi:uncharacterized protein with von Willebrand factor type A (vWA) domain
MSDEAFLKNILLFCRTLQRAGVPVGLDGRLALLQALGLVDLGQRAQVYHACRSLLVHSREQLGHLGLAHARLALQQQGLAHAQGEEQARAEPDVGDIRLVGQSRGGLFDRPQHRCPVLV